MRHRQFKISKRKHYSPIKSLRTEFRTKVKIEEDYFRDRNICYLGVNNDPYDHQQWDKSMYNNPFDDPNYEFPYNDMISIDINPKEFINLRIMAKSGRGKTQLLKNIVCDLHKSGLYNIAVIAPKQPEWIEAKNKGNAVPRRLHPNSKPEGIQVSNYCAGHVKDYANIFGISLNGMKFYSHNVKSFTEIEDWMALGLSRISAGFCANKVKQGVSSLQEMYNTISAGGNDLMWSTEASAKSYLSDAIDGGLFTKHKSINFEKEWGEKNNVLIFNYYQKQGYITSTDISILIGQIRRYTSNKKGTSDFKRTIIVFDDVQNYGDDKAYNLATVDIIKKCQTMYRSDGIDNIVVFQQKSTINKEIANGSDASLLSFVTDTTGLNEILPKGVTDILKLPMKYGGLVTDKFNYTREWLYVPSESIEFYRFIPQGCKVGHDYS